MNIGKIIGTKVSRPIDRLYVIDLKFSNNSIIRRKVSSLFNLSNGDIGMYLNGKLEGLVYSFEKRRLFKDFIYSIRYNSIEGKIYVELKEHTLRNEKFDFDTLISALLEKLIGEWNEYVSDIKEMWGG